MYLSSFTSPLHRWMLLHGPAGRAVAGVRAKSRSVPAASRLDPGQSPIDHDKLHGPDAGKPEKDQCGGRSAPDHAANAGGGGCRLNLLLSYAGWQPDPWVDRLPRLLEPMGVVSHRAITGRAASDLIRATPIHVAVVDLGLPLDDSSQQEDDEFAEGGPRLLEILSRLREPPPVVAVKRSRTHRDDSRELAAALRLGAFAVVDRPHDAQGMNLMLEVLRRCLARHYKGCWPGGMAGS